MELVLRPPLCPVMLSRDSNRMDRIDLMPPRLGDRSSDVPSLVRSTVGDAWNGGVEFADIDTKDKKACSNHSGVTRNSYWG